MIRRYIRQFLLQQFFIEVSQIEPAQSIDHIVGSNGIIKRQKSTGLRFPEHVRCRLNKNTIRVQHHELITGLKITFRYMLKNGEFIKLVLERPIISFWGLILEVCRYYLYIQLCQQDAHPPAIYY